MSETFFLAKFIWNQDGSQKLKLSAIHILGIGYFRRYYWSLAGEKKGFFMFKAKLVAEHVGSMSTQPTPAAHNGLKSFSEGTFSNSGINKVAICHNVFMTNCIM